MLEIIHGIRAHGPHLPSTLKSLPMICGLATLNHFMRQAHCSQVRTWLVSLGALRSWLIEPIGDVVLKKGGVFDQRKGVKLRVYSNTRRHLHFAQADVEGCLGQYELQSWLFHFVVFACSGATSLRPTLCCNVVPVAHENSRPDGSWREVSAETQETRIQIFPSRVEGNVVARSGVTSVTSSESR